jgi:hypothetical protein
MLSGKAAAAEQAMREHLTEVAVVITGKPDTVLAGNRSSEGRLDRGSKNGALQAKQAHRSRGVGRNTSALSNLKQLGRVFGKAFVYFEWSAHAPYYLAEGEPSLRVLSELQC